MTLVTTAADFKRKMCFDSCKGNQTEPFILLQLMFFCIMYCCAFYDVRRNDSHGSFRHRPQQYMSSHNAAFQKVCHLACVPQKNNYTLSSKVTSAELTETQILPQRDKMYSEPFFFFCLHLNLGELNFTELACGQSALSYKNRINAAEAFFFLHLKSGIPQDSMKEQTTTSECKSEPPPILL